MNAIRSITSPWIHRRRKIFRVALLMSLVASGSAPSFADQTVKLPPPVAGSYQPVLILGGIESASKANVPIATTPIATTPIATTPIATTSTTTTSITKVANFLPMPNTQSSVDDTKSTEKKTGESRPQSAHLVTTLQQPEQPKVVKPSLPAIPLIPAVKAKQVDAIVEAKAEPAEYSDEAIKSIGDSHKIEVRVVASGSEQPEQPQQQPRRDRREEPSGERRSTGEARDERPRGPVDQPRSSGQRTNQDAQEGQLNGGPRGPGQREDGQRGPGQQGPGQRGPGQRGPGQRGPEQHGPGQRGPGQHGPDQPGPGQRDDRPRVHQPLQIQQARPHVPGPNAPGPNAPGPNAPGPNAPGPNAPGPNAQGPMLGGPPPGNPPPGNPPQMHGPVQHGPVQYGPVQHGPGDHHAPAQHGPQQPGGPQQHGPQPSVLIPPQHNAGEAHGFSFGQGSGQGQGQAQVFVQGFRIGDPPGNVAGSVPGMPSANVGANALFIASPGPGNGPQSHGQPTTMVMRMIGPPGMDSRTHVGAGDQNPDKLFESSVFKKMLSLIEENAQLKAQLKIQAIESESRARIHELESALRSRDGALTNKPREEKTDHLSLQRVELEQMHQKLEAQRRDLERQREEMHRQAREVKNVQVIELKRDSASADGDSKNRQIEVHVLDKANLAKDVAIVQNKHKDAFDDASNKLAKSEAALKEALRAKEAMSTQLNELEHRSRLLESKLSELAKREPRDAERREVEARKKAEQEQLRAEAAREKAIAKEREEREERRKAEAKRKEESRKKEESREKQESKNDSNQQDRKEE